MGLQGFEDEVEFLVIAGVHEIAAGVAHFGGGEDATAAEYFLHEDVAGAAFENGGGEEFQEEIAGFFLLAGLEEVPYFGLNVGEAGAGHGAAGAALHFVVEVHGAAASGGDDGPFAFAHDTGDVVGDVGVFEFEDAEGGDFVGEFEEEICRHAAVGDLDAHGQFGDAGDGSEVVGEDFAVGDAARRSEGVEAIGADFFGVFGVVHGFVFVGAVDTD